MTNKYLVRAEITDHVDQESILTIRITVSASDVLRAAEKAEQIIKRNLQVIVLDSFTLKAVETY